MAIVNGGGGRPRQIRVGDFLAWEGAVYRAGRRRGVSGLAMFQTSKSEVFLRSLDGRGGPGWVGINEVEPADLPDGWYFARPARPVPGNPRQEWRVVRCVGGSVQVVDASGRFGPHCEHIRDAALVRIEPPDVPSPATGLRLLGAGGDGTRNGDEGGEPVDETAGRVGDKVRQAAEGILDATLAGGDALAAHYRLHPQDRAEAIDRLVRLIVAATRSPADTFEP